MTDTNMAENKTDANLEALESVGKKIIELGLNPDGVWAIGDVAIDLIEDLHETREKVGGLAAKLVEAGLVDENAGDSFDLVDAVITKYRALEGERDGLAEQVAKLDAKAAAARDAADKKAKAVPVKRTQSGRKIGPIKLKDKEKARTAEELYDLIQAAEEVLIVFSDGKNELREPASRVIVGDAWEVRSGALRLRVDELLVYGPNRDEPDIKVHGYGLVLDGELVAYGPRIDVLVLRAGMTSNLKDDIVFFT